MATDMSALREFAFKKLQEARERGTELAAVTAARAASSIDAGSSFVFRSPQQSQQQEQTLPVPLNAKLQSLKTSNDSLRTAMTTSSESLEESIYKLDLINESLAFTIENIQEGSHVMRLLNRQLKDSAAMQHAAHKTFYRPAEDRSE